MRLRTIAFGTLLSVGTASQAWAQAAEIPSVQPEREFRVGASVNTTYSSNIAGTGEALARARGVEPEDVRFKPQATVSFVQPMGRQVLFLNGSAGYVFHRRNEQLDREAYDVSGGGAASFGRCRATAYGSYRSQQSDLSEDAVAVRNTRETEGMGVGVSCGAPTGFGGYALTQRFITKNSAALSRLSDNTAETSALALQYANPTLGRLGVLYSYTSSELPNRLNPGRPPGDGFIVRTVGVSAERDFGSRITVAAGIGKMQVKREFAPVGLPLKFTSTSYNAALNYRIGSRLELAAAADRAVRPSDRPGKLFDISTTGEAELRYRLGSRFRVSVGHSIRELNSNVDTTLALPVVTKSKLNSTFGAISYSRSDRLSLTLDVRREDRETNLPDFNYDGYSVGLTAGVSF